MQNENEYEQFRTIVAFPLTSCIISSLSIVILPLGPETQFPSIYLVCPCHMPRTRPETALPASYASSPGGNMTGAPCAVRRALFDASGMHVAFGLYYTGTRVSGMPAADQSLPMRFYDLTP